MKRYGLAFLTTLALLGSESIESKIPVAGYALAAGGTAYIAGNIYARYIERAAYHRFKDEIEQLQSPDAASGVIHQILQKHYSGPGFWSRMRSRIQLLPVRTIEPNLQNYPFVQCRKDVSGYLGSIWWSQWWTLFTSKYNDLDVLKMYLKQIKDIVTVDYRYTKELQRLQL